MKTKILKSLLTLSTKLIIWIIEKLTGKKLRPEINPNYCNSITVYIHDDSTHVHYNDYTTNTHLKHEY